MTTYDDSRLASIYSLVHGRYFRDFAEYEASSEFSDVLGRHEVKVRPGPYVYSFADIESEALPQQGWKLHVSAKPTQACGTLAVVADFCRTTRTPFKFAKDTRLLRHINSKLWPRSASGKFITIYPDQTDIESFTSELAELLFEFTGPPIPSDRPVKGSRCIWARYGAFHSIGEVLPDGRRLLTIEDSSTGKRVADRRIRHRSVPTTPPRIGPGGVYSVTSALTLSACGGVFRATADGVELIVKQALRHADVGRDGRDAAQRLHDEYEVLVMLEEFGVAPRPLSYFDQRGSAFLVEELVPGHSLAADTGRHNPLLFVDATQSDCRGYWVYLQRVWRALLARFDVIAQQGIRYTDLSPRNIIMRSARDSEPTLADPVLIDFEGCKCGGGNDLRVSPEILTPGFRRLRPPSSGTWEPIDPYSVTLLLASTIFPVTQLAEQSPSVLLRMLSWAVADLHGPSQIVDVLEAGMNDELGLSEFSQAIDGAFGSPAAGPILKHTEDIDRFDRAAIGSSPQARLEIVDGGWSPMPLFDALRTALLEPGTEQRAGKTWSYDPRAYERNAICVAWGDAGIIHALGQTGGCPQHLVIDLAERAMRDPQLPSGLYTGLAGVAWVLADVGEPEVAQELMSVARDHLDQNDLSVTTGVSGVGLAELHLYELDHDEAHLRLTAALGEDCLKHLDRIEDSDHGYASGGCGVATFLAIAGKVCERGDFSRTATALVERAAAAALPAKHGARSLPHTRGSQLVQTPYWERGTAGLVRAVCVAEVCEGREVLATRRFREITADLRRSYAVFPGLCDGLAGVGDGLLDLHLATGNVADLERAISIARRIEQFALPSPQGIGVEIPGSFLIRVTHDLSTGNAGALLFLVRLISVIGGGTPQSSNFVPGLTPLRGPRWSK